MSTAILIVSTVAALVGVVAMAINIVIGVLVVLWCDDAAGGASSDEL